MVRTISEARSENFFACCAAIPFEVLTISMLQLRLNRYKIYVSDDVSDRQVLSDVREK